MTLLGLGGERGVHGLPTGGSDYARRKRDVGAAVQSGDRMWGCTGSGYRGSDLGCRREGWINV